ncbi:hypothetical protein EP7_004691 [Isosphaeraceae bacterium EP7]
MSTKYATAIVGLAAPGVLGFCATVVAWGQEPSGAPAASPAAPAAAPSSAAAPTEAVVLLTNGLVHRGVLSEDDSGYSLRVRGGTLAFRRRDVERHFPSMQKLYEYKSSLVPHEDPDEVMKLAQWCLHQGLDAEAGENLEAVLAVAPDHSKALAMLTNLRSQAAVRSRKQGQGAAPAPLDMDLKRTEALVPGDAPEPINQQQIRRGLQRMGVTDVPVVLDLPPVQAVRQASDFNQYVHKEMQRLCVGCHNEKYAGSFQMIQVKLGRDYRNPEISRQNLDAAISLVNPDNLSQSPLLSNTLLPHGPNKKPILRGPNDPTYRLLSSWVMNMQPHRTADPRLARAGGGFAGRGEGVTPATGSAGGFGASRFDDTPGLPDPAAPPRSAVVDPYDGKVPGVPLPPPKARLVPKDVNSMVPNSYNGANPYAQGLDFPGNPLMGGAPGTPNTLPALPDAPAPTRPKARTNPAAAEPADMPDAVADGVPLPLEGISDALPITPPSTKPSIGKKPAKKIDPALLDRILKNRMAK